MTDKKPEQQRLNESICYELDKWQIRKEYGLIMLDKDKDIRNRYKWINYLKKSIFASMLLDVSSFLFSIVSDSCIAWIITIVLMAIFLFVTLTYYKLRKELYFLLADTTRDELVDLLERLNSYISKLGFWLEELDSHIVAESAKIQQIRQDYYIEKSSANSLENKFSFIFGELNDDFQNKARTYAEQRLIQYQRFIYVQN